MTRWTDEQLAAIEDRGHSILLSAAAGSGKTTVLVERVLRLIAEEGADVDRMLVVTFTRAAASDMRAKLSRKLSERAAMGDVRCREQLMRLDRASISTLHAFCADFLRTNFEAAGVDPAFRVMDDALSDRLREEALDEALEAAYAGAASDGEEGPVAPRPGEDLLSLDYGRGPSGVRAAVEALFDRMEDRPDPEAWLDRATRCDEDMLSLWQDELKDAARRAIGTAIVQLRQALNVPCCPLSYENALRLDIGALQNLQQIDEYDALSRGIEGFRLTTARKDKQSDPDAVEAVKRLRDAAKRALGEAKITELPLLTAREDAQRLSVQIGTLSRIALNARGLYDRKKAEQAGLTYSDLERRTLEALKNPDVARLARARFDYVFVDEYQDTSDIQEAIVSAIRRADNLFMVGDVKQSIYRFRLAEPRLFLEKYAAYGLGEGGRLMPLTRNFRSRRGILDFVNMVFERAMTGGDSEIVYDRLARLNPGDPDAKASDVPDVDIRLIESVGTAEGEVDEAIAEMKGVELEAVLIARTIRRMMAEDASLRFRDFAILTRSRTAPFGAMMPVLLSAGIPSYADGAAGYYDSVEIAWMLNMLRLLNNRRLDVELLGILRSPAVGLTADQLARVRIQYPDVPYCDAAELYAQEQKDDIAQSLERFFDLYAAWRLKASTLSLGEFVRLVLDESGFYTFVGALPGGAQRQANLDQFVVSANRFDQEQSGSLTRFLQYTDHLRTRGDGDAAHLLSENDDVVRMMTIHKSKGLEFKVVFGAQLNKRYFNERASAPLLTHRDLGVGMQYIDPELRTRRLTLPQAAIIERGKRENAAEELRILYVLMTRAQERLILVGTVKDAEQARKRWAALSEVPFAASTHLEVIMAARHAAEAAGQDVFSTLECVSPAGLSPDGLSGEEAAGETLRRILADPDAYADETLTQQMAWKYPDPESAGNPLKLTASGLLRELEGPEAIPVLAERPQFMAGDVRHMTGAERGTAYHRAMQLLDLVALKNLEGEALTRAVTQQLDAAAARRLMTPVQREAVAPGVLARFLSGDIGRRLRRANMVRREWSFNVSLKASEALTPKEAGSGRFSDAKLLVQGTIDCCFIEDGQWVLLDYKTDRTQDMDAIREHYRAQLGLYALALERITGRPVKQRTLCLIAQDRILEV